MTRLDSEARGGQAVCDRPKSQSTAKRPGKTKSDRPTAPVRFELGRHSYYDVPEKLTERFAENSRQMSETEKVLSGNSAHQHHLTEAVELGDLASVMKLRDSKDGQKEAAAIAEAATFMNELWSNRVELFRELRSVLQDLHQKAHASLPGVLETIVSEMEEMGFTTNSNDSGYVSHFTVNRKTYAKVNIRYRDASSQSDQARIGAANATEEIAASERGKVDAKTRCVELAKKMAAEI